MQLNGLGTTAVMAASEPPEPPPRNPDKINASLKQLTDQKSTTKSLDINDKAPKLFKSILSLDNTAQQQQQQQSAMTPTSVSSSSSGAGGRQLEKSPTIETAATSTATPNNAVGITNQSTGGEFRGAASTLFSAATTTISNKINELVNGSIAITGGGIGQYTEHTRLDSKITSTATIGSNLTTTATPVTTTTPTTIDQQCSGEDGGVGRGSVTTGSNNLNNSAAGDYANGDTLNSIDQKNLVFPNESATVYVERRQTPSESGSGSRRSREFDELGKFMNG